MRKKGRKKGKKEKKSLKLNILFSHLQIETKLMKKMQVL